MLHNMLSVPEGRAYDTGRQNVADNQKPGGTIATTYVNNSFPF